MLEGVVTGRWCIGFEKASRKLNGATPCLMDSLAPLSWMVVHSPCGIPRRDANNGLPDEFALVNEDDSLVGFAARGTHVLCESACTIV